MLRRHPRGPRLGSHSEGVSAVVSAVLVFGLIMMVMTVYLTTIVPDRVAGAESSHMRRVNGAFGDLATRINQAASLSAGGQFSQQIDLGTATVPFLSVVESSGRLSVTPSGFFMALQCNQASLLARDGASAPGAGFLPPAADASIVDRLLVAELLVTDYTFGASVTATVRAETEAGASLARVELHMDAGSTTSVRTYEGDDLVALQEQEIHSASGDPPKITSLRVNLLNPLYGFASLLEGVQGAKSIRLDWSEPSITAYVVGRAPSGALVVHGEGRSLGTGFTRSAHSSVMVYESANSQFMDQAYFMEGGAVVLVQETGQYLTLAPFDVIAGAGDQHLRLALVNLTGTGDTVGTHRATVSVTVRPPTVSLLDCEAPVVVVGSEHTAAWAAAWDVALRRAGLIVALEPSAGILAVDLPGLWTVELTEARAELVVQ